jgi:geranylgeranyl diphosphate synthase type I
MDSKEILADFKKKVDAEIEIYLDKAIKEAKPRDRVIADSLKYIKKVILSGGKRLRPAFMYFGYLAVGGKETGKIIKTSVSIELIHTFLLVHDDIIDRDSKRHGLPTINNRYEKIARKIFFGKNPEHFGNSMAIIIGDMIGALGNQVLFDSKFDSNLIMKALSKLQSIVSMTVIGETKDVYIENLGKASEKEIMKMYEYKTAKYTVEGPLHLGAILGGADQKVLENMTSFSIPIGIAFQIQDDILGIFGDENKIGKPVGSDIKGGKQTILIAKARENGSREQKHILKELLGKKDLNIQDINKVKKIIKETGSLDYAQELSKKLVSEGVEIIKKTKISNEAKDFLIDIANYLINRKL